MRHLERRPDDYYGPRAGTLTLMVVASAGNRQLLERMLPTVVTNDLHRELIREETLAEPQPEPGAPAEESDFFTAAVNRWLGRCPGEPLQLGEPGAGAALAAVACGWATMAMHAIAERPRSLTEMARAMEWVDEGDLEERIAELFEVDLLHAGEGGRGGKTYAATDWLRESIGPIAAAIWLERHNPEQGSAPPDELDVEAGFQLALPLVRLPTELAGRCRLATRLETPLLGQSGVTVEVEGGRVVACEPRLDDAARTGVGGSAKDWLEALIDPTDAPIELGGDEQLAGALVSGLGEALFGDLTS